MMLLRLWIVLIPLAMRTRTSLQASNGVKGDQDKYVYANDEIDQTDSRGDDHDEGGFANQLDTPRVSMDNHSNHSMPMNMMQMYFHFLGNEPLLFKGWTLDTTSAVVGACFAFFVVAALYEGLKFLRDWLMTRTREVLKAKDGDDASMPLLGNSIQINGKKYKRMPLCDHFLQTFLHMVQVAAGYIIMLAVMTYNAGLLIAIVVGSGVLTLYVPEDSGSSPSIAKRSDHCN